MDLLHAQFNSGHLSLEEIKTVLGSDFGQSWTTLQKKFAVDQAGKYFNVRLEQEQIKRANYTASRRKNLESVHMVTHMDSHMDDHMENINENKKIIKTESVSKKEITDTIFHDEVFITDLKITHKGKDLKQAWNECWTHHSQVERPPQEVWEWKQKLNTWLTIKQNGTAHKRTSTGVSTNAGGKNYEERM